MSESAGTPGRRHEQVVCSDSDGGEQQRRRGGVAGIAAQQEQNPAISTDFLVRARGEVRGSGKPEAVSSAERKPDRYYHAYYRQNNQVRPRLGCRRCPRPGIWAGASAGASGGSWARLTVYVPSLALATTGHHQGGQRHGGHEGGTRGQRHGPHCNDRFLIDPHRS